MKALSIRQPWASLIIGKPFALADGKLKDVENRTWSTSFTGPLLIHASSRVDVDAVRSIFPPFKHRLAESPATWRPYLGAIIGQVELVECRRHSPSIWAEAGAWHWVLANPKAFANPIPYKSKLGLFEVPDSLLIDQGGN